MSYFTYIGLVPLKKVDRYRSIELIGIHINELRR